MMANEKEDKEKAIDNLLKAKTIWTEIGAKDQLLKVTDIERSWGIESNEIEEIEDVKPSKDKMYKSKFVGRDEEISRLTKHIERAITGDGNFVFVEGEAGIGKTRLVNEVLDDLSKKHDVESLFGRCLEGATPYLPFIQALEHIESKEELGLSGEASLIEEVFFVKDSGLLISHCTRRLKPEMDTDILTGMFTAVQTFIKDSFRTKSDDNLNEIKYGNQTIILEHREGFYLAMVISGTYLEPMREKMKDITDEIENTFGSQIIEWAGDRAELKKIDNVIEKLFEIKLGEEKKYKIDPKDAQEKVFDSIVSSLIQLSNKKSVILFLDDIQWMDESSLSLMYYLAKKSVGQKIFTVCTFRPEDLDVSPDESGAHPLTKTIRKMSTDRLYSKLSLGRLSETSIQQMIDSMFENNQFNETLVELIFSESDGNPFFTEEILASLVEEGLIFRKGECWCSDKVSKTKLPTTVQDVILRRVDRLDREHKKILEYGTVIGLQFDFETLLSILEIEDDEL
ncbi:MAG: AAA family ATPase, partial [Candidatus Heimdallarchaeota archaeon]|nr:AAA family ATPase [Candidatus Heimdallarchaeota archaeon]